MDITKASERIPFSGKTKDRDMCKTKYIDRINICGGGHVISGAVYIEPDDQDCYTDEENIDREINKQIYSDLLLSINDEEFFHIVSKSITDSLRDGDSQLAWSNLQDKFTKKTSEDRMKIEG